MKNHIKSGAFIILIISLFINNPLFSESVSQSDSESSPEVLFDSESQSEPVYKRNFLVALTSLVVPNAVIGSWNRFVSQSSWAQVSFEYACHFYEHECSWDDDWYWTNFVLHPYQGSLSYMGARAANFTPYESIIFSTISSLSWEYFYELNAPSINDMIYTSIGAFPVGEMLYRLSYSLQKLWSPSRFIADPIRLYSDPLMRNKTRAPEGDVTELSIKFSSGTQYGKTIALQSNQRTSELYPVHGGAELYVLYGNPYGHSSNTPYDQFEMNFGFKLGPGNGYGYKDLEQVLNYDIHLVTNGMLLSRAVDWGENRDTTIGLVFDYDFMWQSFYDISSLSPGFAIKQKIHNERSSFEWQTHFDVLLLGTTDFYYYRRNILDDPLAYRSYSYTMGGEFVGGFKFAHQNGQALSANVHSYAMYLLPSQITGEMSTGLELMSVCKLNYDIHLVKQLYIGLGDSFFCKNSFYDDLPNLFAFMNEAEIYAKIQLK